MDSGHGKIRMNVEGDRLSILPDDLILKILSFVRLKSAIRTSVLSSRWRYIWTSMPYLNFSNEDFRNLAKFSKFVTHLLSRRKNQIEVFSVRLTLPKKGGQAFVKKVINKILNYALSHNVQQLNIIYPPGKKIESPLSFFSSKSLKHLTLTRAFTSDDSIMMTPRTWELPSLATLNLYCVTLYGDSTDDESAGLFSNCANLKNLTLDRCRVEGLDSFNICHPGITDLTLENIFCNVGNVVTPELKNLTIKNCRGTHLISAPNLASLQYESNVYPLQFSANLLHLDKADICIYHFSNSLKRTQEVLCMLQQLHSVKILTLNFAIVKLLSSFVELISYQPSPFANLKSLNVHPGHVIPKDQTQPNVTMSTEVKNYLLDGSPGAAFTMVSLEEAIAAMDVASALGLMKELEVLLDQWKENTVHMEQDKAPNGSHRAQPDTKMKLCTGETTAHVESYWKDLNNQLKEGHRRSVSASSMLEVIEEVLIKLPTSHRAKLQPKFSSLCAEVDTIMDDMMHHLKIQCDRKPRTPPLDHHRYPSPPSTHQFDRGGAAHPLHGTTPNVSAPFTAYALLPPLNES
ncbi:hypothetical protein SSX86_029533 [Deinandra increscens subsp. villosa]|uniref:F-box domain-containing protein n=1 Tax=Deinandra increscens subsp. villosa TaxID=3103831 RepID=A0AAP0GK74_9ASTR